MDFLEEYKIFFILDRSDHGEGCVASMFSRGSEKLDPASRS